MGFYRDTIVPRLIHFSMKNQQAARRRTEVVPLARGRVLEIGIGSGLNLAHYGAEVAHVVGIDPSPVLLHMAGRAAAAAPCPVELDQQSAETLTFGDHSFDTVLTTWTLCSIDDPARALAQMRRVMRPDGRLIFIEHGLSDQAPVQAWQQRLNPLWTHLSGGCNMNRPIEQLISAAGFRIDALETGYLIKGPRILTFHYKGSAGLA